MSQLRKMSEDAESPMLVTASGSECPTIHSLSTCDFWLVPLWFPCALLVGVCLVC